MPCEPMKPRSTKFARRSLQVIGVWGGLAAGVAAVLNIHAAPDKRAIVAMGVGLIVIWCVLGGVTMRLLRDRFVRWARRLRIGWRLRFVLLCIAMALLEEAVTTSLTNAAPLLGAVSDAARITKSKNYFEVISGSVVAFIPWFICWAWMLGRYDFKPLEIMLIAGVTGTLAETITFGPQNLAGIGMWTFVYGLMVYLPAHTVPLGREVRRARWWHWIVAVLLPLIFIVPFVIYVIVAAVRKIVSSFSGGGSAEVTDTEPIEQRRHT
ncbi:hypothetical protein LCGC14_1880870 [marine sediment metagenome]|uniref:Uncharacterized protein n=1 Tax=marine sediment metagenome TaxID=412755 RepID=A0A0F9IGC8_9ZZZZ